jgi:hypothetical protein
MIMSSSLKKPKPRGTRHKRRPPEKASAKASSKKPEHRARPTLRELAKEFAKEHAAAGGRVLTAFQRRMMSGGA